MLHGASAADRPVVSRLGLYPGYGSAARLQSMEAWLGHEARYVVQFSDITSASAFDASIWGETLSAGSLQSVASRTTLVESVPLTLGLGFGASTAQRAAALNATLSGKNDAAYRIGAQHIRQAGFTFPIIRLGWEFDGNWMPWSAAGNEALWVNAYRHVANVFRSVLPDVRFDWTGDPGWLQGRLSAYPGDGYVDIVGMDVYDKSLAAPWNPSTKSWVDPAAAFRTDIPSLEFQRDFAIAHGKQVSFPEWALASGGPEAPTSAGNDDPSFIQGMYDWMSGLPINGPGSLAYHAYFNEDTANDGFHMLSHFPNAQARYRALFGGVESAATGTGPTMIFPLTSPQTPGYEMLGADGSVYAFGGARNVGNASSLSVAIVSRPGSNGYWIVDPAGNVSHFGTAGDHGGRPALRAGERISTISSTASGNGYWLFSNQGRVFAYGDARHYGDFGSRQLNGPIVASVATPSGHGYYMVGSDGGVFSFGDARFWGSMGNVHLNKPIVGLSPAPNGHGYWLAASDGGVFAFGAPFRGSMGNVALSKPVTGVVSYGNGYLMVASDGGVFNFSNRRFVGSLGYAPPAVPIVGIAPHRG